MDQAIKFDMIFSRYERSRSLATLILSALDQSLPAEIEPFSFVPLAGLQAMRAALGISGGEMLVDIGCGRGGPSMWMAYATGTVLTGIDISPVAVRQAKQRVAKFGLTGRAWFHVGDLQATGLADESADAIMSVDAFEFADDPLCAGREMFRILRPGRSLVLTNWEPRRLGDRSIPAMFTDLDFLRVLTGAGFKVAVEEHPEWEERREAVYREALKKCAGTDEGLRMFQAEAERGLRDMAKLRRVMVVAQRPA